jgi:hypothetical protein
VNTDELKQALGASLAKATIRVRRPGKLFQVEIPCYLGDGDPALVYVRPETDDAVTVTDLGHTWMRLSYMRRLTQRHEQALQELASRYGLEFRDGRVFTTVPRSEIFAAAIAMAQVQTAAEVAVTTGGPRLSAERFKKIVREALLEAFAERCRLDYRDPSDAHGLWVLDAAIIGRTWVGIAIVPSDLEAERALANKGHLVPEMEKRGQRNRWVVVPRDIHMLGDTTQKRLMESFLAPIPVYDEGAPRLREVLADLADLPVLN